MEIGDYVRFSNGDIGIVVGGNATVRVGNEIKTVNLDEISKYDMMCAWHIREKRDDKADKERA